MTVKKAAKKTAEKKAKARIITKNSAKEIPKGSYRTICFGNGRSLTYPETEVETETDDDESDVFEAFKDEMEEFLNDLTDRLSSLGDECEKPQIYSDLDTPEFDSLEYDYPTKAKAKLACKEAIKDAVSECSEWFADKVKEYVGEVGESIEDFAGEIDELLDNYAETFDDVTKLVFGDGQTALAPVKEEMLRCLADLRKESKSKLEEGRDELCEECFLEGTERLFSCARYFDLCSFDSDGEGSYCYDADDASDSMYTEITDCFEQGAESFADEYYNMYINVMTEMCEALNERLEELLNGADGEYPEEEEEETEEPAEEADE